MDASDEQSYSRNGWTWGQRAFCLITGASQGLGKSISISFSEKLAQGSLVLLFARNLAGLQDTKRMIESTSPGVFVSIRSLDLYKPDPTIYTRAIQSALDEHQVLPKHFEQAIIIHNAGNTGNAGIKASDMVDPQPVICYFHLNVISAFCLNAQFLQIFTSSAVTDRLVINISSVLGVQAENFFATHCAGKASRNMFFKVLASEEPSIKVLNYAPGLLDTDLMQSTRDQFSSMGLGAVFQKFIPDDKITTRDVSVQKLLSIITSGQYKSGDHIDYFDI